MPHTSILLINLGTPDEPTTPAVRRYLKQFLLDPLVIDIPAVQRNLLVRGIIAPLRAPKSAAAYKEIWTEKGSPLRIYTEEAVRLLQESLGAEYKVVYAMRYQNPSIASVIASLQKESYRKIVVIPVYPQYSTSATQSVKDEVHRVLKGWKNHPEVKWVDFFCVQDKMIAAWADRGKQYKWEQYDYVLFSYHGLPERQLTKADPNGVCLKSSTCCAQWNDKNRYCYSAQCYATTRAITKALQIPEGKFGVSFQSRLGKTPWRRPYTIEVLEQLAKAGKKKVLVFCPSFVCDCLETLYEISKEYRHQFIEWGGEELQLVESLNTHPLWIEALHDLVVA